MRYAFWRSHFVPDATQVVAKQMNECLWLADIKLYYYMHNTKIIFGPQFIFIL